MKVCNQTEYMRIIGKSDYKLFNKKYKIIKKNNLLNKSVLIYWNKHKYVMKNFIYSGASGILGKMFSKTLHIFNINLDEIKYETNLNKQIQWFYNNESKIIQLIKQLVIHKNVIFQFMGCPNNQTHNIVNYELLFYSTIKKILTKYLISKNPFYYAYAYGELNDDCCVPYMSKTNYNVVKSNLDRIEIYTKTLNDILKKTNMLFTKVSLLDHMDWLTCKQKKEEFELLKPKLGKNHIIIFRSLNHINEQVTDYFIYFNILHK